MGKFVIRRTGTGFVFALRAANGENLLVSEVYGACAACVKGAKSVARCAASARLADLTRDPAPAPNPRFELYRDRRGGYRFRLRARNGKLIAASECYAAKQSCLAGIESVRANAPGAEIQVIPAPERA